MHKKLKDDLMSLAHSVLQMKNKENVFALKEKSQEIYEKLSLLAFVETYVNETPNLETTKEALIAKVENALKNKATVKSTTAVEKVVVEVKNEYLEVDAAEEVEAETTILVEKITSKEEPEETTHEYLEVPKEPEIEQPFEALEDLIFGNSNNATNFKDDVKDVGERKILTLEEELQDTFPVDVMANLFETAKPATSLNDKFHTSIQIGLNDRITFVKNLFNGNQEEYNRVVSILNTFTTEKEARKFINKTVKPDYNWSAHEELEIRFMDIVLRKFA